MAVKTDLFGHPLPDPGQDQGQGAGADRAAAPGEQGGAGAPETLAVSVAAPTPGPYDYLAPPAAAGAPPLAPGDYVTVPLGGREALGVVWGAGSGGVARARLKPISRRLDLPPMTEATRAFLEKAAAYTMTPLGEMTRLATRAPGLEAPAPTVRALRRAPDGGAAEALKTTPARARALAAFEAAAAASGRGAAFAMTPAALAAAAEVGAGVVSGLAAAGALVETEIPRDPPYPRLDASRPASALSEAQAAAAAALRADVAAKRFAPTLLFGVTGSGKTEVYLEAIAACLEAGRQALVLLPEIALTDAFLTRIAARFGARPAEWHSAAGAAERRRCWRAAAAGAAQVVVGARSALFLPYRDLGLIVVDEEHDGGYKQEEGAIYHARDMAVLRASAEGAAVVLASATPALETWSNARRGKYAEARLPARFGGAVEPSVAAIDLRLDRPERGEWISPGLAASVAETLARGEQALLFLNRRGYAPLTLCRACGARVGCPHCDSWLVHHRMSDKMVCHLCGHEEPATPVCKSCGKPELAACGPGVERLAEEAAARFPEARLTLLSSDLSGSVGELRARLSAIATGETDLVIGTQIVAKGHNFPNLTLVGVVDADLGLHGGDFRAAERTFQLMRQVAGRAGRAEKPGRALLQTTAPEHAVMRALAAGDAEAFYEAEAAARAAAGAPPFGRYLAVIFSGKDEAQVWAVAQAFAREAAPMRAAGAEIFGPAPAPIARIRGLSRARMLVKAPRGAPLQAAAADWGARVRGRGGVRVAFDVDPQSFF